MLLGFLIFLFFKLFKWRFDRSGIGPDSNRQILPEAEASGIPRPECGGHQDESYLALALEPAVGGTGKARDPPQLWGEGAEASRLGDALLYLGSSYPVGLRQSVS